MAAIAAASSHQIIGMKIRETMISVGIVTAVIALAALAILSLISTASAKAAQEQAKIVEYRLGPRLAEVGLPLEFIVTRSNLLEQILASAGLLYPSKKPGPSGQETDSPDIAAAKTAVALNGALTHRCQIVISADLMSPGKAENAGDGSSIFTNLSRDLGGLPLAWRFVLTHEAAHCLPASRVDYEKSSLPAQMASSYLAESFADAYAVGDLWSQDPVNAPGIAVAIASWRALSNLSPSWQTQGAVKVMAERLDGAVKKRALILGAPSRDSKSPKVAEDFTDAPSSALIEAMAWESAIQSLPSHQTRMAQPACRLVGRQLTC